MKFEDVTVRVRNWFPNRCPLVTRLHWKPLETGSFEIVSIMGITPASRRERTQYTSRFQFPTAKDDGQKCSFLPMGIESPYEFNKTIQLQNMIDDAETSLYYQVAQPPDGESQWARMAGLFNIIETFNVRAPVNSSHYAFDDFRRDLISAAAGPTGQPDLLFLATNFLHGLTFEMPIERFSLMQTIFGTPVSACRSPCLPGVTIIEAPLLRPFNAFALRSDEACIQVKQQPHWRPREKKDGADGDWFFELAIDLTNEHHHTALSGVTAFAK